MGCHVLELSDGRAVLHCSCSGVVFGPVFDDEDRAEAFIAYAIRTTGRDPRAMTDKQVEDAVALWKLLAMHWPIERLAEMRLSADVEEAIRLGYMYREDASHGWVRLGLTQSGRAARGES
jgi:hypothetical protein